MFTFQEMELSMPQVGELTPGIDQVYVYLAKRGISKQAVDELGIHIVPAGALIGRTRGGVAREDSRLACVFPHYGVNGQPIDWWSARLVDTGIGVGQGFGALVDRKMGKMFCPPNEAPHAYLPRTLDWSKLQRGDYVYIHESCVKAANGAALGYWSVGLNGVRGWSSRKHDIALVAELRDLPWKGLDLQPIIVFDSNAVDNWDVQHAIQSLAAKLEEVTGQRARHILLPPGPDGTHWGFDDLCTALGPDAARGFLDGAAEAQYLEVSDLERQRLQLQREVVVIRKLGRIAEQDTGTLMTRSTFTDVNYANFTCLSDDDKVVNVPRLWLTDKRRVEVEDLQYVPGGEPMVPGAYLNLWRGMGVEPEQGDVSLWLELLEKQVPDDRLRRWIIQWFAYPLQNLGAKLNSYVHLYGPPGTGKNALLAPILTIYGRNGVVIGKDQIGSAFNSVYATRQFVNIDELHGGSGADALAITNRIKMLTTSPTLTVNKKGEPEYEVSNHVNLATTSNYLDSVKLDEGDRRACVVQFGKRDTPMDAGFWDAYWGWIGRGAASLYGYLLGVSLDGFDAKGHAMATQWKELVTDAARSPMEKWVRDLWDSPDSVLPPLMQGCKVLTPEQVGLAYVEGDSAKNTQGIRNALGQRMQELGFQRTELIKVGGRPMRFWVIDRDIKYSANDVHGNDWIRKEYRGGKDTKY